MPAAMRQIVIKPLVFKKRLIRITIGRMAMNKKIDQLFDFLKLLVYL